MSGMRVTYADALTEVAGNSANAASRIARWRAKYASIVPAVEGFVHERIFAVTSQDVLDAVARGEHALGNVERDRQLEEVEDSELPPTALVDLFHACLESSGLPSWNGFRDYLKRDAVAPLFLVPWWSTLKPEVKSYGREKVRDAIRWRLAKVYLSNMREVHFLARLRELTGISLKFHIFADVRLRTDFWYGRNNISVFLSNPTYRAGKVTRKNKASVLLADRRPALEFHEVEFDNRYDRGQLYVVTDDEIKALVAKFV